MKNKWIGLMLLMSVFYLRSYAQNHARLKDWGIPVAGKNLTLTYTANGGPLEGRNPISAMLYMYNDYKWNVETLTLVQKNNNWEGSYHLPENCAFIAVKFLATEKGKVVAYDNNNDQGFVAVTINTRNMKLPGGNLAWGIFRKPSIKKAPQGYFDQFNISDQALEMWVRKEMDFHPKEISKFFDIYLAMLKLNYADSFPQMAARNLERFGKDPNLTAQGYQTLYEGYRSLPGQEAKADSIQKIIINRFPKGPSARQTRFNQISAMALDEEKLKAQEQFLKDFPAGEMKKEGAGGNTLIYYNTYRQLAAALFASGQYERIYSLLPEMNFATLNEIYRWNIDRIFALSRLPLEKIYPVSKALINEMLKKQHDDSYIDRFSPQQAKDFVTIQLDNKLSIHIRVLEKMGKFQEAVPYFPYLSDKGTYSEAALNEAHVNILENTGKTLMVQSILERGIKANAATPAMIEKLKSLYLERNGKTEGFETYVQSLKSPEDVKKTIAELKAKLISAKFNAFTLKNLDGKAVNSADWKGKIVIIDYWATWCFPCKMAFPGMQQLVNRYADDKNVNIFFIATMEKKPTYKEDIKQYLLSSGYNFNVLFDDKNQTTGENDRVFKSMTPIFRSSAIPRKVVIKDGVIRYTAEGYSGSPSKLLDELSYVIELLKAE